ncbi:hypothetical protein [Pseudooceanicola marinus]|uniref:hypothetical protein n=1 Tax=Pseudooceanicola marinus TaxID=396013 RepID=UPI001CD6A85E|nr:hypothetical protein [Pseudooceanicola marinus]MCA1336628.1 hypothetical protein [Pseudooceanicola marinus]
MSRLVPEGADDPRFSGLLREVDGTAVVLRLERGVRDEERKFRSAHDLLAKQLELASEGRSTRVSAQISGDRVVAEEIGEHLLPGLSDVALESFTLSSYMDSPAALTGYDIIGLQAVDATLRVKDCTLRNLLFGSLTLHAQGTVRLEDCRVGRLVLSGNGEPDIVLSGGRVLVIEVQDEPNLRSLNLSGVQISRQPVKVSQIPKDLPAWLRLDAVSFRRLHKWAQDKEDVKLAHQMRGHQLSVDYYLSDRTERPFMYLWRLFGNYGLSLWRPMAWLLASNLLFGTLLYCTGTVATDAVLPVANAVAPGTDAANAATLAADGIAAAEASLGWRSVLIGDGQGAQLSRAIVGATEAIFSPVNVFSIRKLVLPTEPWVAVVQFLYSYLCLGLIFLFGFSIRRRFKI